MDFYGLTAQMSFLGFYLPGDRMKLHQENDKIIVTELRPMSDVPTEEDCEILVKVKGTETLQSTYIFEGKFIDHLCDQIYPERIEGWLPMPIYQPEKIIT